MSTHVTRWLSVIAVGVVLVGGSMLPEVTFDQRGTPTISNSNEAQAAVWCTEHQVRVVIGTWHVPFFTYRLHTELQPVTWCFQHTGGGGGFEEF